MIIFFHGYSTPSLEQIQNLYSIPWDSFNLKVMRMEELKAINSRPDILVFTLFKGESIQDFRIDELRSLYPKSKFLCLANSFCLFVAEDLADAGIDGYEILGNIQSNTFLPLLEEIIKGEKKFPSLETKTLEGFTTKELITIRHIASGLTAKQIAYLHKVTENTIKKRKQFIMERLNKHTTEEIASWAAVRMNIPNKEALLKKGEPLFKHFQ